MMEHLSKIGRIFYGISISVLGIQTLYYHDFPYMLIPPHNSQISGFAVIANISGLSLALAGLCIIFEKKIRPVSLLLGALLLVIFCLYYVPYEFIATSNYLQPIAWDSAEKELALSAGAFVIAGCFPDQNGIPFIRFLGKFTSFGAILFSIIIFSFGIDHFLYAKGVAEYIPTWIPNPVLWAYLAGAGLFGTGLAMLLRVKPRLFATLLGTMILIWFIILHVPKAIAAPASDMGGEVTSAFLALAYCGIAFVIAGASKST